MILEKTYATIMNLVNFCVLVDDSELENLSELNKEVPDSLTSLCTLVLLSYCKSDLWFNEVGYDYNLYYGSQHYRI